MAAGERTRRPVQREASDAHDGAVGLTRSIIPASAGVRSPLRWLHGPHAATVFFHVFRPPRDRGVRLTGLEPAAFTMAR